VGVICSERVLLCTVEQGLEVPSLKYRGFASTQQEKTGSVQDDALNKGIAASCC
jgi:hypothetical protein